MSAGTGTAVATSFVWLGMVIAISFLEAPLKFRAPGVDLRIGLGIGRLVFRALNAVELVLAAVVLCVLALGSLSPRGAAAAAAAPLILALQLIAIRPRLHRRSDLVLTGAEVLRSHAHLAYIAAEVAKVAALLTAGVLLLTG
ncbi:MAG: hypothetical protein ACT4PP_14615 [Sporichthyaceae bacterium]